MAPIVSRASPTHLCHRAACHHRWHPCPFGNPTQITLLRMPVSAGSLHEKTVHNETSLVLLSSVVLGRPRPQYRSPAPRNARGRPMAAHPCGNPGGGIFLWSQGPAAR